MDNTIYMSIDPLYGEGDCVEWEFFSKRYSSFIIAGSEKSSIYRELEDENLFQADPTLIDDDFFESDEPWVFYAKGIGIVEGYLEINSEDDLTNLTEQYGYKQMFSEYKVEYPNRFYRILTTKNDSECEEIWIPEANLKFVMLEDEDIEYEYPQELTESLNYNTLFSLGDKVDWQGDPSKPAIMRVPYTDGGEEYVGYTEIKLTNAVGIVAEKIYYSYLPARAYVENSKEQSIKEERFWNSYIPFSYTGWVYKLEIELYGKYGDFWVSEEQIQPSSIKGKHLYDLVIVPPFFLENIQEAA